MSFKDTFTRTNSSENLRYDDNAAYHFYMTILIIVVIPLAYSLLKTIFNPFSHIPTLAQLEKRRQFRDKISKFKKQNKYSYITFKFILKVLFLALVLYGIVICTNTIMQSGEEIKGFDPYQILEVDPDAPIQKIKKAYRKLALLYHPDRNPDNPQASAKFIMISKAYECLTDEQAKQKCLKYGNPDGAASINVGIALPQFLVKKENHLVIMGIIFVLVVIVLPIYLIHYHSEMNKYDDFGMMTQNQQLVNFTINQQFSMKDAIKMVACCAEFANMATSSEQIPKLEILLKQLDQEQRKNLTKKNYKGFIKKTLLLIDARMNQKAVPKELEEDLKFIMKKTPAIVKSSINSACQRSGQFIKNQPYFVGKNCIQSLILFQQYFIQGKSYEDSESFVQLDLSAQQTDKILRKKKNKKITDLKTLMTKEQERDYFLSLLDGNRSAFTKECIQYFPFVEVQCDFKVEDDSVIGAGDFFQIVLNLKSNRLSNFCSSVSYPYLKMQGWHLIVSDTSSNAILLHEFFNFDELLKSFKITSRQEKQGKYSLNVLIMPDCYFGLDIDKDFKYEVTPMKAHRAQAENQHVIEQKSYIQKMMQNLMPAEEEQVSDKQDEPQKKQLQKQQ